LAGEDQQSYRSADKVGRFFMPGGYWKCGVWASTMALANLRRRRGTGSRTSRAVKINLFIVWQYSWYNRVKLATSIS
jgi:hypothetical protein